MKKDELQHKILSMLVPYRIAEKEVIISYLSRLYGRKYTVKILSNMEKKKYIERMLIYRKAITDTWQILPYQKASVYQKRVGYEIERITPLGFVRLLGLARAGIGRSDAFLAFVPADVSAALPWGLFQSRADGVNRCRKKQAIVNTLKLINIDTSYCYEDAMRSMANQLQCAVAPKTISEAIAAAVIASWDRPQPPTGKSTICGIYFNKLQISDRKPYSLDNLWGVVAVGKNAYPVYHTDNYYGTAWGKEYKQDTKNEIRNFFVGKGMRQISIPAALMFTSSPKEFADMVLTCHDEKTEARKLFLGYKPKEPVETKSISDPFAKTIVVPEQGEAPEYLKFIFSGRAAEFEELLLGSALTKKFPDAVYNMTAELKADEEEAGVTPVFHLPDGVAKHALFISSSFPFSVVLSSACDAPVVPVLLGYEMELTRISRAFYFYQKTTLIGTYDLCGEEKRAMVIACFDWQMRWYKKLFPDAIYLCNILPR